MVGEGKVVGVFLLGWKDVEGMSMMTMVICSSCSIVFYLIAGG